MARKIKFRAWHKHEKRMYEVGGFFFSQVMFISAQENATSYTLNSVPESQVELMQYTGLLDKSGRGIYEGDIVKHPYVAGPCVIAYSSDAWQGACFVAVGAPDWCLRERPLDEPWEIIGNIYEHPELIKKDQKQ